MVAVFPLSWPSIAIRSKDGKERKCHTFNVNEFEQSFVIEKSSEDPCLYIMTAQKAGAQIGHLIRIDFQDGETSLFQIIGLDHYGGDPTDMWIAKLTRSDRSLSQEKLAELRPPRSAATAWQIIQ
jgi:hypothetical protein